MCLDVVDVGRCQLGRRQRLAQQRLLCRAVGDGHPAAGAVLVDRRTTHQREDAVAVALGVDEPLEDHDSGALAADVPVGARVEGLALARRRQHAPARAGDAGARREQQIGPTHQRGITFPPAQALAGEVDGHQRRRARRVQHHRGAADAEQVGQPPGGEVRRVPGQHIGVEIFGPYRAGHPEHVVIGGDTDEYRGLAAADGMRRNAGVLQRFPRHLEEQPLLRVHGRRLARGDGEEFRIELVGLPVGQEPALAVADGARHGVVFGVEGVGVPASGRDLDDAAAPVAQQVPELIGTVDAAGEAATHADHRDRFGARLLGDLQARGQIVDLVQRFGDDRPAIRCRGGHDDPLSLSESCSNNSASLNSS